MIRTLVASGAKAPILNSAISARLKPSPFKGHRFVNEFLTNDTSVDYFGFAHVVTFSLFSIGPFAPIINTYGYAGVFTEMGERRQNPRFACGGRVRIASLPLEGDVLRGKLLDLSLGGCCIEIVQPLEPGTGTEILLQVNDASFRALSHVIISRGRLAGLQFVRLTESGNLMLRDLVADVAKFHAAVSAHGEHAAFKMPNSSWTNNKCQICRGSPQF